MESEMVERVALALHEKNCEGDFDVKEDFYSQPDWWQRIAFDHAKAAIQAMRDVTPEMAKAGIMAMDGYEAVSTTNAVIFGEPKKVYQAMIDAALSGKSGMGEG